MQKSRLTFIGSQKVKLAAQLDTPDQGAPRAYALFAHCFTCTKNLKAIQTINQSLTEEGIAVLRFDFTGLGESEGDFADTNFSSNVDDLVAAAQYLETEHQAPKILIGHSLGGAAVLQAAARIESCRALATIAAPAEPSHVVKLFQSEAKEIEEHGEASVRLAGREFTIKKQFIDDLEQSRMTRAIANLRRALAIFHSPIDNIVGIDNAAAIFQAAKHPKSFISLDQADHLLSREEDSRYVGRIAAAWCAKYFD